MIEVCDVGSLPFEGDEKKLVRGAKEVGKGGEAAEFFERLVIKALQDKMDAGVTVPNYPQFRDMNEMFLEIIEGVEKIGDRYYAMSERLVVVGEGFIPELVAIRRHATELREKYGEVKLRVCVTGPYTLSHLFGYRDARLFTSLGEVLAEIVARNIFKERGVRVHALSLDEPVFGLVDDPLKDHGSEGREALLKAWEKVFYQAASRGVDTVIHLHSTADILFLEVDSLKIIESHVGDPLYSSPTLKRLLEQRDKFVKASLCRTDFDELVKIKLAEIGKPPSGEEIAAVWRRIKRGEEDPVAYLEDERVMIERLRKTVELYGDRVIYAGPECGLRGFPTYGTALEYLRRVSRSVKAFLRA